jgi:hypothetical protein
MAERTCSVEGCERFVNCRGWCKRHYRAWRLYGDPLLRAYCSAEDCRRTPKTRGMCGMHYQRWLKAQPPVLCSVDGCEEPVRSRPRQLCAGHLHRLRRYGSPTGNPPTFLPLGLSERTCTRCKITKPITDFSPSKVSRDGRYRRCQVCTAATLRYVRSRQTPEVRERRLLSGRRSKVRTQHGEPGLAVFKRILAGEPCEACGERPSDRKQMHIDHDHVSGVVRGLLCHSCNTALGLLNDDPARFHGLLTYLERSHASKRATDQQPA